MSVRFLRTLIREQQRLNRQAGPEFQARMMMRTLTSGATSLTWDTIRRDVR